MAVYYVSTTGSDDAKGSIDKPFASLDYAHSLAQPGDTIYIRGGTYSLTSVMKLSNSGTEGNPIKVLAYEGETPVFDGAGIPTPDEFNGRAIQLDDVSWNYFKGIEIKNGPDGGLLIQGDSSNNVFEGIVAHDNGRASVAEGTGIALYGTGSDNLFLNCDSYANYDVLGGGENADGFAIDGGSGNVLKGCRAWQNSDDGFDFFNASFAKNDKGSAVVADTCWAWGNGYSADGTPLGDGNGFKLGGQRADLGNTSGGHLIVNCVSWDNLAAGFDGNNATNPVTVVNSTAFNNGTFDFHFYKIAHILTNNLAFAGGEGVQVGSESIQTANSWILPVKVSAGDFLSLSDAVAKGARQADGSLPDTVFLHLVSGSDLIDIGVAVAWRDSMGAPDLGAFESDGSTPVAGGGSGDGDVALDGTTVPPTTYALGQKIIGSKAKNVLVGGDGDDLIKGLKANDKLFGVAGDNKLLGGGGKDKLVSGTGDDVLKGGGGKDIFVFNENFGNDRINDFDPRKDTIQFDKSIFASYSELQSAMTAQKDGVLIQAGDDSVFLAKVKIGSLDAHDFLFV